MVTTPRFFLPGVQVQSLLGDIRSHKPGWYGQKKKKKSKDKGCDISFFLLVFFLKISNFQKSCKNHTVNAVIIHWESPIVNIFLHLLHLLPGWAHINTHVWGSKEANHFRISCRHLTPLWWSVLPLCRKNEVLQRPSNEQSHTVSTCRMLEFSSGPRRVLALWSWANNFTLCASAYDMSPRLAWTPGNHQGHLRKSR